MGRWQSSAAAYVVCALLTLPGGGAAQSDLPASSRPVKETVGAMLTNEDAAAPHKDHYAYLSKERSERTGGHLWTEKVVETNAGRVRMLIEEDGQKLGPERIASERGRLANIVADPAAFQRREEALKNDEAHAKEMLLLLRKAYLFGDMSQEGGYLRIDFRPDPGYQTQSMEERVLHGMSGTMLIDPRAMRLHRIDGRLPQDVSIGFGLLATVHAGSNFAMTRNEVSEGEWKTTVVDTNIDGRAIFFKAIGRNQHAERANFVRVPNEMSVAQAVEMVER